MLELREVDGAILVNVRLLQDVTDELLHLNATQPCLLALPCQAVHQLLQVLPVQDPIIIKVFGQKKVMFLWGPCDSSQPR